MNKRIASTIRYIIKVCKFSKHITICNNKKLKQFHIKIISTVACFFNLHFFSIFHFFPLNKKISKKDTLLIIFLI